jgi:polysaccharide export outer membrane protein
MRYTRLAVMFSVVVLAGLLALNLRAQIRTQEKLDALAAALAARPDSPSTQQPAAPAVPAVPRVPRELDHPAPIPPYVIEAPDVLTIEAVLKDPKTGAVDRLPTQPISGPFVVRPDGTVGLGFWGSVAVTGLTPDQAVDAIRKHLAKSASDKMPAANLAVVVDVLAYNSKKYYVILDGGAGETVYAFPVTGSETVLDAIANVNGLAEVAGKKSIRIARKTASGPWQNLPVDWKGITQHGVTATNYQLMPSDRLYVTASRD